MSNFITQFFSLLKTEEFSVYVRNLFRASHFSRGQFSEGVIFQGVIFAIQAIMNNFSPLKYMIIYDVLNKKADSSPIERRSFQQKLFYRKERRNFSRTKSTEISYLSQNICSIIKLYRINYVHSTKQGRKKCSIPDINK